MGWTPLHTACRDGDMKRLNRCVNQIKWLEPLNVNEQTMQGHTPLHMCAANGHVEIMQFVLNQKGCDPNIQTKLGNTAIHLAGPDFCPCLHAGLPTHESCFSSYLPFSITGDMSPC